MKKIRWNNFWSLCEDINFVIDGTKILKTDKILVFLMYDMDVPVVNERIKDCRAYKLPYSAIQ